MATFLRQIMRGARRIPGAVGVLEPLRRTLSKDAERLIDDFDRDIRMSLRLNEHMESQIYWYGVYSRDVLMVLRQFLRNGVTVFDVGANVGEISLYAAKYAGPEGRVFSFEPLPELAARLRHHKKLNSFGQLTVVQLGLGEQDTEVPIYQGTAHQSDGLDNSGTASLFRSGELSVEADRIRLRRADDFAAEVALDRLDVMKIDIEGAELPMLRGASEIIRRYKPVIIVEVNKSSCLAAGYEAGEILHYLYKLGYDFQRIGRKGRLSKVTAETLYDFQNVLCLAR